MLRSFPPDVSRRLLRLYPIQAQHGTVWAAPLPSPSPWSRSAIAPLASFLSLEVAALRPAPSLPSLSTDEAAHLLGPMLAVFGEAAHRHGWPPHPTRSDATGVHTL
jgi:hypothetical protein